MKIKNIIFLALEGGLILGCAAVIYALSVAQVQPVKAYRFTKNLPANAVISVGDYEAVEIPASALTPDFTLKEEDLLGKGIKSEVYPGEYVLDVQLAEADQLDPFKSMDLTNKVKIAIPINGLEKAVGGLLNNGDLVDLYFTASVTSAIDNTETTYSTRFLTEVPVYKVLNDSSNVVKNDIETGLQTYDSETGTPITNSGDIAYVICAVSPEEALEIQTRLATGTISLVGRFDETETKPVQDYAVVKNPELKVGTTKVENTIR